MEDNQYETDPFEITEDEVSSPDTPAQLDLEYFDFHGVQVPYRAAQKMTVLGSNGAEVRSLAPQYITNLQQYMENGNDDTLQSALGSFTKEALLYCNRASSLVESGWEAPIAVSAHVPIDHVYVDEAGGRIVLNEFQATSRYIDADGDRGPLIYGDDKESAILVKYPITSPPLRLQVMKEAPKEGFHNFGLKEAKKLLKQHPLKRLGENADELELFLKAHNDVPVGLYTNAWNSFDLFESQKMSFQDRLNYLFNSFIDPETGKTQRALDIEDFGMKTARKEHATYVEEAKIIQLCAKKALSYRHAWALTSCSSIGKMKPNQLDWFNHADLDQVLDEVLNLRVTFRTVRPNELEEPKKPFVEKNLFLRLKQLKLIDWLEIPHVDPDMPPSVMFWLTLPDGTPIALTDVKRSDGRDEGLTYAFTLAPVFDNYDILNQDGEVVEEASQQWEHPINHMQKYFYAFDSTIRPWSKGPIHHYFPFVPSYSDWENPKRATKIAMLYKAIMEYCGRYGDPAPAYKTAEGIQISTLARSIIARTAVIDYGKELTGDEMYPIAKKAQETCNICIVGSKSTSRRVRKYMLANKYGGSCLDPRGLASLHRAAKGRSQLQRGLKMITMRVAVCQMDTLNQILITSSGIAKQDTNDAFLPQVFGTEEDYLKHLEAHGLSADDFPANVVDYKTWQGEARRCWTVGARNTIAIGKLVDIIGNKFMPRWFPQVQTIDYETMQTEDVDLLFPINELVDKDAHHAFLENAIEQDLVLDNGDTVKCLVTNWTFIRTGAASENIPPRWRRCSFKGIDAFPIYNKLKEIKHMEPRKCRDITFAKMLQAVKKQIMVMTGHASEYDQERTDFLHKKYAVSYRAQEPLNK